ncbi:hypothetical protein CRG98_032111 [Punica granatum]|uniref:Uncharacterized protein n=1 Tax=Punica granatum TaxID=22663 RepID=A0A2I0IU58_PUNGR|nr:hypothetical protein CRG98_032111 [Punica granatum]
MTAEEERATQPSLQPGPFVEEQVTQMEHVVRRIPAYMEMCFKGIEDMLRFHGMSSNLDMSQHHVMPTWTYLLNEDWRLSTPKLGVSTLSSRRKALPCLSRSVTTLVAGSLSTLRHHGLLPPGLALMPLVTGSLFDARAGVQRYEYRGSPDQPSLELTG